MMTPPTTDRRAMASDRPAIIAAQRLRVVHGDVVALAGLDLEAPEGCITALLGPNGAGKTTFVRTVATLQRYDGGTLRVAHHEVAAAPVAVRSRIGLAGQHAAVVPKLTGRENLLLVARLSGQRRAQASASAHRVIAALDLADFADRRVERCSGGQRRRIDLAATLVTDPEVMLLDEPTAGLDPHSRDELWQIIRGLPAQGTSVLLTTQYLEEAQALADHVVIIDHGRTRAAGSPAELRWATAVTCLRFATPTPVPQPTVARLAGLLDATVERDGDVPVLLGRFSLAEAYHALDETGLARQVTEVELAPPSLDEVFRSLTQRGAEVAR